jgi:DNA-binding XRE family transcriptional regulator
MSISPAAPSRYCSPRCRKAAWQTRHRRARDSTATNVVATIHDVAGGLSQESFALVLGVHRTYMGGLERGERNLTLKAVERIAGLLDIDPLDLITGER